jgi:hypothetical protein
MDDHEIFGGLFHGANRRGRHEHQSRATFHKACRSALQATLRAKPCLHHHGPSGRQPLHRRLIAKRCEIGEKIAASVTEWKRPGVSIASRELQRRAVSKSAPAKIHPGMSVLGPGCPISNRSVSVNSQFVATHIHSSRQSNDHIRLELGSFPITRLKRRSRHHRSNPGSATRSRLALRNNQPLICRPFILQPIAPRFHRTARLSWSRQPF